MTEDERRQVREAFHLWAQTHPQPDLVLVQMGHGVELTPRDIARHMSESTKTGEFLLSVVDAVRERVPIEEFIHDLTAYARRGEPPPEVHRARARA